MNQRRNRITLKDIARQCGCSVNTVSRALRNDTRLSDATLSSIKQTAQDMGYIRNGLASSLRSGKSHLIAVIVDDIQNQHYSTVINQMNSYLADAGYDMMILCTQADEVTCLHMINVAISHAVDGILFFPYTDNPYMANLIWENQIPFVLIDRGITDVSADLVRFDDYAGGCLAGTHLLNLGHRKFLYIAGPAGNGAQIERERGFADTLVHAGIPLTDIRILSAEDTIAAIANDSLMKLLSPIDYTAIFSFNDLMAYPVMDRLRMDGYSIPGEISVIGFDYIRQAVPYLLPLCSVSHKPEYNIAETAVRLLLERIKKPSASPKIQVLPVTVYEKDSTTGPAKG